MTQQPKPRAHKSYLPNAVLTSYVSEKLLFEQFREDRSLVGQTLQRNKRYAALKKHKSDAIDKIFESMANLMFIFDSMNQSTVLAEDLLDATMQVTGIVRNSEHIGPAPKNFPPDPYLEELLRCMAGFNVDLNLNTFIQKMNTGRPNRLVPDHQVLMAEMMHSISSGVFVDVANTVLPPPADAYEPAAPFIAQDIVRASAWVVTMSRKSRASVAAFDERARTIRIPKVSDLVEERRKKLSKKKSDKGN